ncbi:hypothetical protein BY996DRAFT_6410309 [Phakopsora pachyrhizi]|nr:hypothetical protein BY996DRAFT_6410309 [Phakopsora pachyrhizi]
MLLDFNTPVGHLPKNIHDVVYIMQPICNPPIAQQTIWANLLFESLHLVARDIIAPVKFVPQKVTTENTLSVEYTLAGFLASCFSFNKNRGAILPMEGCLEWPLYCLLMAFCAAGVRGLMLGSNDWRKFGALESLQIITLSNEVLKLKGNDFEEPYWPRTSKYILQIIKSCFLPADPKSHKPMCPSRYEIVKCIVLDFGDTWHSKVDDSRKQHLSLPKKALVNAEISELS